MLVPSSQFKYFIYFFFVSGIQLVKQLAAMPDRMKAKAEACVYLGKEVLFLCAVLFLFLCVHLRIIFKTLDLHK